MNTHSILAVFASVCAAVASAADLPRLAVLAEDATAESRNMADLIQAELSNCADVEMVERAEIERVLREQELTAAGLTDAATRVQLGQILKAKGLVFVGPHSVRVVETSDGFLAGSLARPQQDTLARASAALSMDVVQLLPKLTRNPELHTCVTILRFTTAMLGTAGAHEDEPRLDALMLDRLTAALCAEPDVLVMERRRTGDLKDEASLAGERLRLKSGALIVDGELASVLMEATGEAKPSATLTVRVRDLTGRAIAPVVVRGFRSELDKLAEEAVFQTLTTVRQNLRVGSQDTLKAEAEALLFLAKTKHTGMLWASEAAYALDPTNSKVREEFIKQLFTGENHPESPVARYYGYARMEQIFRETKMTFPEYMYLDPPSRQIISDLSAEESFIDPELVTLLRPLRQAMERIVEKSYSIKQPPNKKGPLLARMMIWASALAGTNRERYALRSKMFERVATDPDIDDESRNIALGYMLTQHNWKDDFLLEQSRSNDPVRRFFAYCRLMWKVDDKDLKRAHANAAAREVDALLERRGTFGLTFNSYGGVRKMSYVAPESLQDANCWFIFLIRRICTILPEMKEPLTRKVFERAKVLLAEKDYMAIELLEPQVTFLDIPEKEFLVWIDELLKDTAPPWGALALFGNLRKCAADIRPRVATEPPKASTLERETLFTLSDFEKKWKLPDLKWRNPPSPSGWSYESSNLLPCRLLLDGKTLWVALSGLHSYSNPNKLYSKPCGLVSIDTSTGKIISGRFGWHECPGHNLISTYNDEPGWTVRRAQTKSQGSGFESHMYPILPLVRFNDFIVVPHGGVGVGMFPVQVANASDLNGIEWLQTYSLPLTQTLDCKMTFFDCTQDRCYLSLNKKFILTWKHPAQTTTVIFDAGQKITGLQMRELDKTLEDVWFDHDADKLVASGRYWTAGSSRRDDVFAISFNPKTDEWELLGAIPERPDVVSPSKAMWKVLAEDNPEEFIADVAAIDNTTFYALTGFGTKWKLEKVSVKNEK